LEGRVRPTCEKETKKEKDKQRIINVINSRKKKTCDPERTMEKESGWERSINRKEYCKISANNAMNKS
jgi:hypothetical protein